MIPCLNQAALVAFFFFGLVTEYHLKERRLLVTDY